MDNSLILYFLTAYAAIQLLLIFATIAWVFHIRRELGNIHAALWDVNNEIVTHAVALHEAKMIPLPWEEVEGDLEDPIVVDAEALRDGNVYYLGSDD